MHVQVCAQGTFPALRNARRRARGRAAAGGRPAPPRGGVRSAAAALTCRRRRLPGPAAGVFLAIAPVVVRIGARAGILACLALAIVAAAGTLV